MLYFVRFFTLVFIYSSCFVIPAQNIVNAGLIIIFDVTIYYLVFFKYTKAVVKSFNKIGVETFKSNYKKAIYIYQEIMLVQYILMTLKEKSTF